MRCKCQKNVNNLSSRPKHQHAFEFYSLIGEELQNTITSIITREHFFKSNNIGVLVKNVRTGAFVVLILCFLARNSQQDVIETLEYTNTVC